jgi:hypothetical protein
MMALMRCRIDARSAGRRAGFRVRGGTMAGMDENPYKSPANVSTPDEESPTYIVVDTGVHPLVKWPLLALAAIVIAYLLDVMIVAVFWGGL